MSQDEGIQGSSWKDRPWADSWEGMAQIYTDMVQINCRTGNCIYIKDQDGVVERLYTEYKWYEVRENVMKQVCAEDQERCRTFTSVENLQRVSGGEISSDTYIFRKIINGEYYLVQSVIIPEKSGSDCVIIYTRDADESVRAEEHRKRHLFRELHRIREAELVKTEFLRYAGNELYTVMDMTMNMEHTKADGAAWERVHRMGRYMTTRMRDLVTLSDLRQRRIPIHREVFVMDVLLQDCQEYAGSREDSGNISFEVEVHQGLQESYLGDVMRLMQVLFSLLANAFDYNRDGGSVRLEVGLEEAGEMTDRVFFLVSDTGRGISEEFLPILYDRFTREKPEFGGNSKAGLGLLLVKIVLESMGGIIEVDTTPGEGSSFRVSVPLAHVGKEKSAGDNREGYPGIIPGRVSASRGVLLVDDNEINLEMAAEQLKETGYVVVGCLDGETALRTFSSSMEGSFDIVLTDMEMPGMDGAQLAGKIRELSHPDSEKVCIVGLSSQAGALRREKGKRSRFGGILGKPFDIRAFGDFVQEYRAGV